MIDIRKLRKKIRCSFCEKDAVKTINGLPFCPHCLDGRLIRIIASCVKNSEEVSITFRIIPKGLKRSK